MPITDSDKVIELMGKHSQIKGGWNYLTLEYENGYAMKAYGELRPGAVFLVYKSSMKDWLPPRENDVVDEKVIAAIIKEVTDSYEEGQVKILFE